MKASRVVEIAKAMFKAGHTVREVAEELNLSMSHTMKLKRTLA